MAILDEILRKNTNGADQKEKNIMQINVTDIHTSNSVGTYGYCTCGREVRYGKDKECPVCKAELIWKLTCGFDRETICDQECRYYQTCARNPHRYGTGKEYMV